MKLSFLINPHIQYKAFLLYLVLGLFLINCLTSCKNNQVADNRFKGDPLPSFKILSVDSVHQYDTKNAALNKPAILFYFGPNCPYSRAQMEEIVNNINELKDFQLYVFTTWPFPLMKDFGDHYKLKNYSNIKFGLDYKSFFLDHYSAEGVPYTAVFGKDKLLKKTFMGKVSFKEFKKAAEVL